MQCVLPSVCKAFRSLSPDVLAPNCKMRQQQFMNASEIVIWGWFFMIFGSIFFSGFLYAAVISKLLPPSDNAFISAIQNDRYYCFLVPLTVPVIVMAVYCHWLSMKLFKHA